MTMRKIGDVLATVGEAPTDAGPIKRRIPVGALFQDDRSGAMSLKLEAVPVVPGWSGWLAVNLTGDGTKVEQ